MSLKTAALWIHVLAGVGWIGVCGSFVLASIALAGAAADLREFASRSLPRLNRICIGCACIMPVTGVINLAFAARARADVLPREFLVVLGVKLLLFTTMAWALAIAIGRTSAINSAHKAADGETAAAIRGLTLWYGLIALLGSAALGLGLWLSGV